MIKRSWKKMKADETEMIKIAEKHKQVRKNIKPENKKKGQAGRNKREKP